MILFSIELSAWATGCVGLLNLRPMKIDSNSLWMRKLVKIMRQNNLLLWEEMLRAVENPDMGVVDEMKNGTELVGCIAKTGIRPTKFQPASVGLDELRDIACRERNGLAAQFTGLCDGDIGDQVWQKTLQEVETGALVGPIPLDQVPPEYPLSRRFGIQQGAKVRCIDDFSRSSVNSSVQSCENPKPHTLDVFAALCVHLMSELEEGEQWYGRTLPGGSLPSARSEAIVCTLSLRSGSAPSEPWTCGFSYESVTLWINLLSTLVSADVTQPMVCSCQRVQAVDGKLLWRFRLSFKGVRESRSDFLCPNVLQASWLGICRDRWKGAWVQPIVSGVGCEHLCAIIACGTCHSG